MGHATKTLTIDVAPYRSRCSCIANCHVYDCTFLALDPPMFGSAASWLAATSSYGSLLSNALLADPAVAALV